MADLTRIATCSYCRTRSVLRLRNIGHMELTCASCGAPLHEMKPLKVDRPGKRIQRAPEVVRRPDKPKRHKRQERKRRKRSSGFVDWIDDLDVFDWVEDLLDIFD